MRWPIRNQILVPFAIVLVLAIAAATFGSAWLASRRVEERLVAELNRVLSTLGDPAKSSFPLSPNVLETMHGLSGAEFVVLEGDTRRAGTVPGEADSFDGLLGRRVEVVERLRDQPRTTIDGERYVVVALDRPDSRGRPITLVTLYPETALDRARREATLPPLLTGAALLLGTILLAAWVASRATGRIRGVQQKVARVASGDFDLVDLDGPDDEIRELSASVNRMAAQLRELQDSVRRSERGRLLGQLAGGLAHQLRNAATGARLALQLHAKRNADRESEELDVALRQLGLVEEQIKSLLALGREGEQPFVPSPAVDVAEDVARLVRANCEHANVDFAVETENVEDRTVADGEGIRSAVLNLLLNAIEAAGPSGRVRLRVQPGADDSSRVTFDVVDSGPGPTTGTDVFEPFVTTKPEGVGLGLALVKSVAERNGGTATWSRENATTTFRLTVPSEILTPDS